MACEPGTFNKDDYESGDGMLTSVWGPSLWHSIHTMSFNYPVTPCKSEKHKYYNFILSLKNVLPCRYCRENFTKNLKSINFTMKDMNCRESFSLAMYNLHEEVNRMLGKKSNLTFSEVRDRYETFRARCLDDKGSNVQFSSKKTMKNKNKNNKSIVKEKGCVKPLHGVKSKCVIKIVPKNEKCSSFQMDPKCKLRRSE
jgi:hypothetical protein